MWRETYFCRSPFPVRKFPPQDLPSHYIAPSNARKINPPFFHRSTSWCLLIQAVVKEEDKDSYTFFGGNHSNLRILQIYFNLVYLWKNEGTFGILNECKDKTNVKKTGLMTFWWIWPPLLQTIISGFSFVVELWPQWSNNVCRRW